MKRALFVLVLVIAIAMPTLAQAAPELKCVAFTCQDLQNPFFKLMGDAVRQAARDIGGDKVRVLVESGDNDLNKQFQQIDDFIAAGAQIIVLNACDSEG
ncbi:MAG: substrate-binding domain-containing protein, partial [Firmicutes bacterium]|nr:substrate-binding domain-containing protein [Bacillota bacterium]